MFVCGRKANFESWFGIFRTMLRKPNILGDSNMKKIVLAALASSVAMAATPAFAASSDQKDFDINATVKQECSMENPTNINLGNLSINRAPGQDALLLDGVPESDIQNVWMSCNYNADITITTLNRALKTTSPVTDTAQFTDTLHYGVSLVPTVSGAFDGFGSWKPRVQPVSTTKPQLAEFHDNAQLSVKFEAPNVNNKRPVAGDYTDTVTVTLGTI